MHKRIFGLDLMRAIAILSVVIGHGGLISQDLFSFLPDIPLVDGVELFFVLSGFLIGGILIRDLESHPDYGLSELTRFWKRRWFRTLPNYYLILLANMIVVYLGLNGDSFDFFNWKFFFFLQNTQEGVIGFFWESWSLTIEEWFYLLIPLALMLFNRFMRHRQALLLVISISLLLPLLYRLFLAPEASDYFWWTTYYKKPLFSRLDAIIYGVLGAYWSRYHKASWSHYRWYLFIIGCIALYSAEIFNTSWDSFYGRVLELSVIPLGALFLLPLLSSWQGCSLPWFRNTVVYISKISYSMYLINLGLVSQVIAHNVIMNTRSDLVMWYIIYWTAVLVMSGLLYRYFERPMTALRDKY